MIQHAVFSTNNDTAEPPSVSFAPLACPPLFKPVTDMHPRVYLAPDAHGNAHCPYCGERYTGNAFEISRNT
jgi:uncharacterized Zn-finger protein